MSSRPRRLSGALGWLAGPLALIATFGAPADAQPACVAGPIAGYLTPGFQCQLAGWRFFDFQFNTFAFAAPGTRAAAPDALGTTTFLTPFTAIDALGRSTFGFDFAGFAIDAATDAGPVADPLSGVASSSATLVFQAESIDPTGTISHAFVDFLLEGSTATPALTNVSSVVEAIAGATPTGTGGPCLGLLQQQIGPGGGPQSYEQLCAFGPQNSIWPILIIGDNVFQSAVPEGASGAAAARFDRIGFVHRATPQAVVPEPSTVALLTGGLLALGALWPPPAGLTPHRTRWNSVCRRSAHRATPSAPTIMSSSCAERTGCPPHSGTGVVAWSSMEYHIRGMTATSPRPGTPSW
jgi:hypothetical protein